MKKALAAAMAVVLLFSAAAADSLKITTEAFVDCASTVCSSLLKLGKTSYKKGKLQMKTLEPCYLVTDDDGNLVSVSATVTVDMENSEAISTTLQNFGLTAAAVVYAARLGELNGDLTALAEDAGNISQALSVIDQVTADKEAAISIAGGVLHISADADTSTASMTWSMLFAAE